MSQPTVIVTRRWPEPVERRLGELFDTRFNTDDRPLSVSELQQALQTADAVLPTVTDRLNTEVFSVENIRTRILGNFGVGFNHIDLDAAGHHGMTVTNTPGVLTDCTADIALTLLLMVARRAGEGERMIRAGAWSGWCPTQLMGSKVTGKTLGVIGMGRIGQAVARRAHHGFGMSVIYHNRSPIDAAEAESLDARYCDTADEVLEQADFISLHCPAGPETRHLINAERLQRMKPGAYLINTARGDVVDEAALAEALQNNVSAGAGLDVYEAEPKVHPDLVSLDNVVLLPHLGSASEETRVAMGMKVIDNLQAFFAGQTPPDKVL